MHESKELQIVRSAARENHIPPFRELLLGAGPSSQCATLRQLIEAFVEERLRLAKPLSVGDFASQGTEIVNLAVEIIERNRHLETIDEILEQDAPVPSSPKPSATLNAVDAIQEGSSIGQYKLLQQIGEGGMGTVWMAQQETPVRRRVAVKVIRPEIASRQFIARFEAERQALAMMDHQNIARVLDAGTTEGGGPYFVMELVKGVPLNKFCDDHQLSVTERLRLFIPVCNALQHAHQKGIIHRDLKPTNVLVALYDGVPVPKVIDFGLAKALEQSVQLTEKTMFTRFGQIVGTLQYMSPEQAEMNQLDVDTRSDIYSLGVMLYELLSGSTPIASETLQQHAMLEVLEAIRRKDPPPPSHRLSSTNNQTVTGISRQRSITPAKLMTILRGELDWVVMKALEKDRSRRYDSASGLADDIERYLNKEAIQARPPSTLYRLSKFASRNRGLVTSLASMALLLLLGIAVSSWFAWVASNAKEELADKVIEEQNQRRIAEEKTEEAQTNAKLASLAQAEAESQTKLARQATRDLKERLKVSALQAYAANMQQVLLAQDNNALNLASELLTNQPDSFLGWEYRYLAERQRALVPWQPPKLVPEDGGLSINVASRGNTIYYCWSTFQTADILTGTTQTLPLVESLGNEITGLDLSPDASELVIGSIGQGDFLYDLRTQTMRELNSQGYDWIVELAGTTKSRLESCSRGTRIRPRFADVNSVLVLSPTSLSCVSLTGQKLWDVPAAVDENAEGRSVRTTRGAQLRSKLDWWEADSLDSESRTGSQLSQGQYSRNWFRGFRVDLEHKQVALWSEQTCWVYGTEFGERVCEIPLSTDVYDATFAGEQQLIIATESELREYATDDGELVTSLPIPGVVQLEADLINDRLFLLESGNGLVSSIPLSLDSKVKRRWLDLSFSDYSFFGLSRDSRYLFYNNGNGWNARSTEPFAQRAWLAGQNVERIWSLESGRFLVATTQPPYTLLSIVDGNSGDQTELGRIRGVLRELKVSPDGTQATMIVSVTSVSESKTCVGALDLRRGTMATQYEKSWSGATCLSPSGTQLICRSSEQNQLDYRDVRSAKIVGSLQLPPSQSNTGTTDSQQQLSGPDEFEDFFDPIFEMESESETELMMRGPLPMHIIDDSQILVDTTSAKVLTTRDLATGATQSFSGIDTSGFLSASGLDPTGQFLFLAFSEFDPDSGAKVLAASRLHCFDLTTGEPRYVISAHVGLTRDIKTWNDRLFTCGDDGTIKVWDLDTGIKLLSIPAGSASVRELLLDDRQSLWYAASSGLHRLSVMREPSAL